MFRTIVISSILVWLRRELEHALRGSVSLHRVFLMRRKVFSLRCSLKMNFIGKIINEFFSSIFF